MNYAVLEPLCRKSLAREITFRDILATMDKEGVECNHIDFLRNECRYYPAEGESLIVPVAFEHGAVPTDFSAPAIAAINERVASDVDTFADFVRKSVAAGCAYYIVYARGRIARYFGRDGGEHVQVLPGGPKVPLGR